MVDSHCHISFARYDAVREQIIKRFVAAGGQSIVDIATHLDEVAVNQRLVKEHPEIFYTAMAVHPAYVNPQGHEALPELSADPEAYWHKFLTVYQSSTTHFIGETGMDRSELNKLTTITSQNENLEQQGWLFQQHIRLAQKDSKPLIIHSREATIDPSDQVTIDDIISILKQEQYTGKIIFHSFVYAKEVWERLREFDYYIGINGVITYSGTSHIREAVAAIPLDRLLLETDGPYLLPANVPPTERIEPKLNEPQFVAYIAQTVAKIRGITQQEVLEQTTATFSSLVKK